MIVYVSVQQVWGNKAAHFSAFSHSSPEPIPKRAQIAQEVAIDSSDFQLRLCLCWVSDRYYRLYKSIIDADIAAIDF